MDPHQHVTFPAPIRLEGFGVLLREWRDDDAAALVPVYDDPEIHRWTPVAAPFDTVAARVYIAAARGKRASGRGVQLAITTDGTVPLGEVLMFRSTTDARDVELAYGVGPAHRGRGLASASVRLATGYVARHIGPRRVVLRIEAENAASEAVAAATGFALTDDAPVVRRHKERKAVLRTWCHEGAAGAGDSG
ncbi:GNAT family N-acetyltransferase [Streptomyces poonensis]|uniref:N-acetyltransferase domain-containing protein n=1 Tax=Streptomyces poonensis TaxID=68255 RepID=A0A918UFH2_9ACTN|nr:GNAT family N-acetyltransferase [Streptomyces poonensis]GGZ00788.1 hypothetical protein GCM10010365_19510 [Streptomyces poonensis]GLJ90435.1 hypothetical protein GCM10017589_30380 [Streptomyces poonensis]